MFKLTPSDIECDIVAKQGITNMLALPVDKMLYIYLLCPHSKHQKNPFQSKQSKHFHQRNQFTSCETNCNKVKLPKVGSNVIVPIPVGGARPNNANKEKYFKNVFDWTQILCDYCFNYLSCLTNLRIIFVMHG
jgi:hypothetical protein